jgi:hypothetical protein
LKYCKCNHATSEKFELGQRGRRKLTPTGTISRLKSTKDILVKRLLETQSSEMIDSHIFGLIDGFSGPDISYIKTDFFQQRL